ncbi:M14 family metallocarboxypeptidase [Geobacillus sp. FSL W8-0032]|uniref:Gamma-D-glutamyl-L-diamino acid endopeptidase 1 n=1 Tax=Geobacillus icigianus TaxID=1430331 RepID=A0ABU6BF40_9BACL|nr:MULTISPECIES: M14 family metallocarboxypeptidase [Geobacillus]KYD29961.1 Gamma-D-glutamyl-L-diamino acid endopeptidase I [Geobacillus sp. B4113_201601]MEB3750506.1 Gamma-D-glutamyl-L-diamino acid endopeptidase 1 [Geobacillus icigianus]
MRLEAWYGDTFEQYGRWFSVPTELIVDANPHIKKQGLQPGQTIEIPGYRTMEKWDALARCLSLPVEALQRLPGAMAVINGAAPLPERISTRVVQCIRPYDFAALTEDIDALVGHYPFVRRRTIGHSVLGLPLVELQIGRGPVRVHVNGSFHANEWITSAVVMALIDEYVRALVHDGELAGRRALDYYHKITLSVVPMVNPDGVNLVLNGPPAEEPHRSETVRINGGTLDFSQWKANIRGVDLNNQFPANWEIEQARKLPKAPAPRDFPGFAPLTEPEAKAMAALTEAEDFWMVVAFHTQGKEIYWGYEGLEPPEAEATVKEMAAASGYQAVRYIDSHAGYRDWFIQTRRRRGYTVELGEGTNPLPLSQFDEIYRDSLGLFSALLQMA